MGQDLKIMADEQKQKISVGIIMDGNRRWAKEKGLSTFEGHKKGYEKIKELLGWCEKLPISALTMYAFSKENWKREASEVGYLMDLIRLMIKTDMDDIVGKCLVKFIGDREDLPDDLKPAVEVLEQKSEKAGGKFLFQIALSYSGRDEIIRAIKKIENPGQITEQKFSDLLDTAGIPDPDIIIRTSGENRLSGFLTWQSVYSELFFIKTYWPDFSESDLSDILRQYYERKRRFGK